MFYVLIIDFCIIFPCHAAISFNYLSNVISFNRICYIYGPLFKVRTYTLQTNGKTDLIDW